MKDFYETMINSIDGIDEVDFFECDEQGVVNTGIFVGRPFHIDYYKALILVADSWKLKAKGIPQGAFLLAYYENEQNVQEALLLRVIKPCSLPTDNAVISSMVEHYKDNMGRSKESQDNETLDSYTRYEFSFSGLECRILGTFYRNISNTLLFGADIENFYSAHNYRVVKPKKHILQAIVNFKEEDADSTTDIKVGYVRYSSSRRFQETEEKVPVYVRPQDFLGKRTALFGMTRTGKSNTVKKIIEASVAMSSHEQEHISNDSQSEIYSKPKQIIGQIIFDINGEYANANLQDSGTAIFEMFKDKTIRYSVLEKEDFLVMKVNFYEDILAGFELVKSHLAQKSNNYTDSFRAVDLTPPDDGDRSAMVRHFRRRAAYVCCLYRAGFSAPKGFKVFFEGNKELNSKIIENTILDPSTGLSLEDASKWFEKVWEIYEKEEYFKAYAKKGHEWADEELKAILTMLTRYKLPGKAGALVDGYKILRPIRELHTDTGSVSFDEQIIDYLRNGKIVIVDLSQGDPSIQQLYSERICRKIFFDSMNNFISNRYNNFIQFYFEEAHNLFPKKDDKDLSQIYNRLAKEGAKLNLGMVYATQEVSSISANILKNTQNWFVAHLNNDDETKEIKKYYDYSDFVESLVKFSAQSDKGFVRMKTYSNPFVVPVQIDKFPSVKEE